MHSLIYLLPIMAYLYGSVPFGLLTAKLVRGVDIRDAGSGNIGATNAARVLGGWYFPPVFLLDFSKGFLPTMAALYLTAGGAYEPSAVAVLTALAAILGHVFPVYIGFKGGKAVATGSGAFVVLAPWCVVVAFCAWVVMFVAWRYVSLASITAAASLMACAWLLQDDPTGSGLPLAVFATAGGLMVIALHHGNIGRLLRGEEHKIGRRRSTAGEDPEG